MAKSCKTEVHCKNTMTGATETFPKTLADQFGHNAFCAGLSRMVIVHPYASAKTACPHLINLEIQ